MRYRAELEMKAGGSGSLGCRTLKSVRYLDNHEPLVSLNWVVQHLRAAGSHELK